MNMIPNTTSNNARDSGLCHIVFVGNVLLAPIQTSFSNLIDDSLGELRVSSPRSPWKSADWDTLCPSSLSNGISSVVAVATAKKVHWPDTSTIVAMMADESLGQAECNGIGKPMGRNGPPKRVQPKLSVAHRMQSSLPFPAGVGIINDFDVLPESQNVSLCVPHAPRLVHAA